MRNSIENIADQITSFVNEQHRTVSPGPASAGVQPVLATPGFLVTTTVYTLTATAMYTCFTAGSALGNESVSAMDGQVLVDRDHLSARELKGLTLAASVR